VPQDVCHDFCVAQIDCYNTGDDPDRAVDDCYEPYDALLGDRGTRAHTLDSCSDALDRFECPI
jgi:hypothetical protein